ncbi:MAG: large subunit ribosomal protein [Solirubrobacteraceae bacterium]|jgi:large subunit ribosomal protein L25|nr:large subunit ribosomal protein [Solirubrobacteraceae bacterium]
MASQPTKLNLTLREPGSSRATRRLRREGRVPGVLYGGGDEPVSFLVDARELRHALAARGAVLELTLDGTTSPAVLKDSQHHPVRGETMHVDFLRVRLDQAIHATVVLDLVGAEDAPGVKEGGVLEQVTREVNIEALPGDIPEVVAHDVSQMQIGDTVTLSAVTPPRGVTLLDDLDETVIASLVPPTVDVDAEEEGIEQETERVGEGAGELEGSAADADAGDVPADAGDAQTE